MEYSKILVNQLLFLNEIFKSIAEDSSPVNIRRNLKKCSNVESENNSMENISKANITEYLEDWLAMLDDYFYNETEGYFLRLTYGLFSMSINLHKDGTFFISNVCSEVLGISGDFDTVYNNIKSSNYQLIQLDGCLQRI